LPSSEAVLWASAIGIIGIMGGIIAWLINKGFDTVKASIEKEFQVLWKKFEKFQENYTVTAASLQAHREAEEVREKACAERHQRDDEAHRALKEEIDHLKDRKGERRHAE